MEYGLVLAGGGARGAYQIGVMRAIKELNIEISAVSGTSIGAINGALFAQGSYETAEEMWTDIRLEDIVKIPSEFGKNLLSISNITGLVAEMKKGGFDISPLENLLKELVDEDKLRSSEIDFGLTSVSLTNKKAVSLFKDEIPKGKIYEYLIASASLPIFKTKTIGGERFADGGFADNMPVDLLIKKGIKDIITVDVHGVGMKKDTLTAGVNLIEIECSKPRVGTMDFDPDGIKASMEEGYYDTKKVMGYYGGKKYFFDFDEYNNLKRKYGIKLIEGLEDAAEAFGLDELCVYGFDDFLQKTLTLYRECERRVDYSVITALHEESAGALVVGLVGMLKENKKEFLSKRLDIMGKYYNAASSLMYFVD